MEQSKAVFKIREFEKTIIVDLPERIVQGGLDVIFKAQLMEVVARGKNIGINMSATVFIDSGIVTGLLAAEKALRSRGKKILLIKPSEHARELFMVTSINRILPIVENEAEVLSL